MKNTTPLYILILSVLLGCYSNSNESNTKVEDESESSKMATLRLEKLWETDTLLTTSESVIYNSEADILYVSNVNGNPLEKDGNGFIAQLDLDGNIIIEKWITELDAPKGMGIYNGKLYVTNITEIVEIDIENSEITNRWEVAGSIFLNDITISNDGAVYFTDSHTNKIHRLINGEISEFVVGDQLGAPNGLHIEDDRLMLSTMGNNKFGYIDLNTKEFIVKTENIGAGDGVAPDGDGHYLVSSWSGEVFHINGETWMKTSLLRTEEDSIQSADITYVADKKMLFVPTFFKNSVTAYRLIEEKL